MKFERGQDCPRCGNRPLNWFDENLETLCCPHPDYGGCGFKRRVKGFEKMGGLVGVIANDAARFSLFTACVFKLDMPKDWKKEMLIGGDWCKARNNLVEIVLEEGYSHLWFMDDDHAFPPSMLKRLLFHDVPVVTPLCLTRVYPFEPVQYSEHIEGLAYLPMPLSRSPQDGLIEIAAGGCAGMLIKREVFEAIEPPWFEYTDRSEDIIFCEKAKAAGFSLYCDLNLSLGHITTAVTHAAKREGQWITALTIGTDLTLFVDTADVIVGQTEEMSFLEPSV